MQQDSKRQKEREIMQIFTEIVDLLADTESVPIPAKVTSFLHLYNATDRGLKAYVFKTFVRICQQAG